MSKKKQTFIIDHNLSFALKSHLPGESRTIVECGLRPNAPDYPDVVDLCQRRGAMLVTADTEFTAHLKRYQREHNDCCWGLLLLPSDVLKQINMLKDYRSGRLIIPYPLKGVEFRFDKAQQSNLCVNLRANPPETSELCDCAWGS